MGPYIDGHLLSWLIFMPGLTVLGLLLSSGVFRTVFASQGMPGEVWRALALSSTSLTAALAWLGTLQGFDSEHLGLQFIEHAEWMPRVGLHYFVAMDGISLPLVLMVTTLVPLVLLASWHQVERSLRSFVFYVLSLETAVLGVLLAWNVLLFHVFWQLALILVFFLIGSWGGPRGVRAATRFLLVTGLGSFCMGLAILVLAQLNLDAAGLPNLDLVAVSGSSAPGLLDRPFAATGIGVPWWRGELGLFAGFALAFAAVLPLVPLHLWLPSAEQHSPGAGAALIAGLLLLLGPYGFLRLALPLFPTAAESVAPYLMALAVAGVLYAVIRGALQVDLARRFAFVSVAQLGLVVAGLFSMTESGLVGGVVATLSHSLTAAGLFFVVGLLHDRRRTGRIDAFGGLAHPMPVLATLLAIVMGTALGLPLFSGFVGDLLLLAGIAQTDLVVLAGAVVGVVGLAVLLLLTYRRILLGPLRVPENRGLIDLNLRERAILVVLIVPMLWLGLHPNPVLRRVEPSVLELMRHMDGRRAQLPSVVPMEAPELAP
ncbi:MAG: NADH-quinone oxidoreductase subunit M [Myxococcota bacterium]